MIYKKIIVEIKSWYKLYIHNICRTRVISDRSSLLFFSKIKNTSENIASHISMRPLGDNGKHDWIECFPLAIASAP